MQTSTGAFNAYTRSNHSKDELQMAISNIPRTSGVYKITCTANGKIYIGSSVNLCKRFKDHFSALRNNRHFNPHLQRAWNNYSEGVFTFEVIELVMPWAILDRENYWLKILKPYQHDIGFNISPKAEAGMHGRKHNLDSRTKMSKAHIGVKTSPETIAKRSAANTGKKRSPEARMKMSLAAKGRIILPHQIEMMKNRVVSLETRQKISIAFKGKKLSDEHRAKIGAGNKGKVVSEESRAKVSLNNRHQYTYIVTSPDGEEAITKNLKQFCIGKDVCYTSMSEVARGLLPLHKGWIVRRIK